MGYYMREDDGYIPSMLDMLNIRFGPIEGSIVALSPTVEAVGGIVEMKSLQEAFQIFRPDRRFVQSAAALNLGGTLNPRAKHRWFQLLDNLVQLRSNVGDQNGDTAIVTAIINELAKPTPRPIHFEAHDSRRGDEFARVLIDINPQPIFYLTIEFLTISIPMRPAAVR